MNWHYSDHHIFSIDDLKYIIEKIQPDPGDCKNIADHRKRCRAAAEIFS